MAPEYNDAGRNNVPVYNEHLPVHKLSLIDRARTRGMNNLYSKSSDSFYSFLLFVSCPGGYSLILAR